MSIPEGATTVSVEALIGKAGLDLMRKLVNLETMQSFNFSEFEVIAGGREYVNKQGKITKRIKRNLRRDHDVKIENGTLEKLGNFANKFTLPKGDYTVEITTDFHGTVGRFGDAKACFQEGWEMHSHLLAMDDHPDFYAVRVYKGNGDRLARCWAYDSGNGLVVFNVYMMTNYKIAKMIAMAEGKEFTQAHFTSDIHVNQENTYVIGGEHNNGLPCFGPIADVDNYDGDNEYMGHCDDCGDRVDFEYDGHITDIGGFCDDCWSASHFYCEKCGHDRARDDYNQILISGQPYHTYVCESCAERHYYECDRCEKYYSGNDITHNEDNAVICDGCYGELETCDQCSDAFIDYDNDMNLFNDLYELCDGCYDSALAERKANKLEDEQDEDENKPKFFHYEINDSDYTPDDSNPAAFDTRGAMCGICGDYHAHSNLVDCEHCQICHKNAQAAGNNYIPIAVYDRPCASFCGPYTDERNAACVLCVQQRYNPYFNNVTVSTNLTPGLIEKEKVTI